MDAEMMIGEFLELNGFTPIDKNTWKNDMCVVEKVSDYYRVSFVEDGIGGVEMSSSDINIYWLIGMLTYNELMDRNYKTNFK